MAVDDCETSRMGQVRYCVPADWRRPDSGESYNIHWCDERAFGVILPRPDPADIPGFYDVDEYYTHHRGGTDREKPGVLYRILTKLAWWADHGQEPNRAWWSQILPSKPLRILKIGCGDGANLDLFASLGHSVAGVEPDPAALREARCAGHDVYAGTAEDLHPELAPRSFDVIVFMHVLEHCLHPEMALENAAELLDHGGLLVAEVPNNRCKGLEYYGVAWYWLDVPRHLNFYTLTSLQSLVENSGYDIGTVGFCGYVRQFDTSWLKTQRKIADVLGVGRSARFGLAGAFGYLFCTCWASNEFKYDSVRVVARVSK